LLARLRAESALAGATLYPSDLPGSAVVVLRRLTDPLPGMLSLRGPSRLPPPAWRHALDARIAEIARRAARPSRGAVPPDAEAIVFADRSELLACLARDWLAGELGSRWWWRSLFPRRDFVESVLRAWLESPQYVPAALELLAEQAMAAAFVAKIGGDASARVTRKLLQAFALTELCSLLDSPSDISDIRDGVTTRTVKDARRQLVFPPRAALPPDQEPPWHRWAPEAENLSLALAQRLLLGLGLGLRRAPAAVRTKQFAELTAVWLNALRSARAKEARPLILMGEIPDADETRGLPSPSVVTPPPAPLSAGFPAERIAAATLAPAGASPAPAYAPREPALQKPARRVRFGAASRTEHLEPAAAAPIYASSSSRAEDAKLVGSPASKAQPAAPAPALQAVMEASVDTALGGLFYLINLGLFLELYGDFTSPRRPGIELGIWDFVALLGERMLGPEIRGDNVWALLARLAGRDQDGEFGCHFDAPSEWRIAPAWLAPFVTYRGVWRWWVDDERLRVRHQAGFLVTDLPREKCMPMTQVSREVRTYRKAVRFRLAHDPKCKSGRRQGGVKRWLGWLVPYVLARLERALGMPDGQVLVERLLRSAARVRVSPTHVDVTYNLAELPIEIRLAVLDRNPGWVPSAGRYIAFHYE